MTDIVNLDVFFFQRYKFSCALLSGYIPDFSHSDIIKLPGPLKYIVIVDNTLISNFDVNSSPLEQHLISVQTLLSLVKPQWQLFALELNLFWTLN